jgi:hypothetical protein
MISGFSADMLKIFLKGGELNPLSILNLTLEPYLTKVKIHERDQPGYSSPDPITQLVNNSGMCAHQ